jgi:uncharacterized 2Fe-2S/4Fe-4S cluster protein (DUF4445 family)
MTSLPAWLKHQPIALELNMELAPPQVGDNIADVDRLRRALEEEGYAPLEIDPTSLNEISRSVRDGEYRVKSVTGWTGSAWHLLDVRSADSEKSLLGFAVDLGSSRLAFYLVDLEEGAVIDRESVPNPQVPHGEDILTRILFARDPENLRTLQRELIEACNDTFDAVLERNGLDRASVCAVSLAGNTTMSHFFLGLDPTQICKEPYIPVANRFPFLRGRQLGLHTHPRALVYLFPNVGSYFGGDVIAGTIASGLQRGDDISMLVDVGTNAEVVVGNRDWLIACAGAAGPALEGGVVERGMMAGPGAIDRVRIDPDSLELTYRVLGSMKPAGICGSGLIDLVAEMFSAGLLTIQGKINTNLDSRRIVETDNGPAFVVAFGFETADGEDLTVSQIDIGILLKSKAAMYTILTVILRKVGLSFDDVSHFYVCGTFGNHIDPAMAVRIGMVPDLPLERFEGLGNTAGRGAYMLLLDRSLLDDVDAVCNQTTYVEMNVNQDLINEFRGALFLPHTDPSLFPSVTIPERALGKPAEEPQSLVGSD